MTRTPPALPPLEVELPDWPAVQRARRRVDAVRSGTGRVATVAGVALGGSGLLADQATTGLGLAVVATTTAAGLVTLRAWRPAGHQRATASVLYLMPGTGLTGLLLMERLITGPHWSEALALTVWATATWALRPARMARRMLCPPPAPAPTVEVALAEEVDEHPAARWWAERVAVDGGAAPGTLLGDIEQTGEKSMRAVIRSADPTQPVPDISTKRLSALMDVPEDEIDIRGVSGRGAGLRQLSIGPDEIAIDDPVTYWEKKIAPKAMPGTRLAGVRTRQLPSPQLVDPNGEQ
ncbi:hypothetical protein AB0F88_40355 [Streptosporangium sp. NPDC023963]|uniref:hypothetical protein n=1 Tax=Streptosporangium sp. NPDC023963 TaxID=3155608 RepID=UPI00341EBFCD